MPSPKKKPSQSAKVSVKKTTAKSVVLKKTLKKAPVKKGLAKKASVKAAPLLETLALFKRYYPDAHCALNFTTPYELMVATILSAQCTDERVNMVTPALFKKFGTPQKMAKAPIEEIEELIRSTGFYKNKSKSLKSNAMTLVEKYDSQVPQDLGALVELAGVGRKTANVVLGNAFDIASGIVVDTHVTRLCNRLGWVHTQNAVIIEKELLPRVPQSDWVMFSHYLISHGRAICKARKPACSHCFLEETCPKKGV